MSELLIKKYFEENNIVKSNIESFDGFVEWRLQKVIDEIGSATPAVIPPEAEDVKLVFGKVRIEQPCIVEADGAKRKLLPSEARLRDLTYAAPVFLEVSLMIDGKERERSEVQIVDLPIMLKSKLCYLNGMSGEDLINAGEDPYDQGGYFIINGTERALVLLEDLAGNTIFADRIKTGPVTHQARIFSSSPLFKIPHTVQRTKEGTYIMNFANIKKVPAIVILKALGMTKDADIANAISSGGAEEIGKEDVYLNLIDFVELKTDRAAQDFVAKSASVGAEDEQRFQRVQYFLDNLLLPHIGTKPENRYEKAVFIGRMVRKIILLRHRKIARDDKDHYMNKRVRLSGDLLEDLFRANMKILVNDMLYIFQRGVRRGRILPLNTIIRTKFLSQRVKSAMATGNWTGNRQGVSQRLERDDALATLSHLMRVSSLLEASRESFEARELHSTHYGRFCLLETPEGKHVGLRKNLAMLSAVTPHTKAEELENFKAQLENFGLKKFRAAEGAQ